MTLNKKHINLSKVKYTILLLSIGLIVSCKKPPEYPTTPEITFESIELKEKTAGQFFDTIEVAVYFKDGDGDLGLASDNIDEPYNEFNYVYNDLNLPTEYGDAGTPPYNAYDYTIIGDTDKDTFLIEKNPYFFNFIVDFYKENTNTGEYEKIDYRDWCINSNICIPFHGRFQPLSDKNETLEGTIKYQMVSSAFPKGNIKFDISIYDRALNKSNIVQTTPITIE